MQNNNPNDYLQEDEITLKEIFKLFANSKKLIIAITFVITTLGVIYSFQEVPKYKSTALVEIGSYTPNDFYAKANFDMTSKLIEPLNILIQELNTQFIHKKGASNINFKSIEDRIIQISQTSPSAVNNIKILNEAISYIENRHSLMLTDHNEGEKILNYRIESLNNEFKLISQQLISQHTNRLITLNAHSLTIDDKVKLIKESIIEEENNLKLLKLNPYLLKIRASQSPSLQQAINSYNMELVDFEEEKIALSLEKDNLESELKSLESGDLSNKNLFHLSKAKDKWELELEFLMSQNPTSSQLISEIVTNTISHKELYILMSFIFGLFLSIIMVFINNFLKAFKEKQV
jgi:capsular polysaccharide biosynthesis protein